MSGSHTPGLRESFDSLIDMAPDERERALAELEAQHPDLARQLRAMLPTGNTSGQATDPIAGRVLRSLEGGPPINGEFGPYRLLQLLGSGGMGWVYLAERETDGVRQQVALKLVRGSEQTAAIEQFQRERTALASLRHPNIARFLDAGSVAGQRYLAMEYVEGQSLANWLEYRQPSLQQRLDLIVALAMAVDHAHANLIVHRDLKPSNLLVRDDDSPVLLDFGIAKLLGDSDPERLTSTRIYTPTYAAPEQIAGQAVTVATDVHALGLLLFELLCGEPARSDQDRALRTQPSRIAQASSQAWVRRDASHIDIELDRIVAMALREEPERRYRSAADLVADVQRWQRGLPVQAMPDSATYRTRKWLSRHRWGVSVAAAALLATLFFVVQLQLALDRAVLAEQNAQRKADTAQAVADLMTDLFSGADPSVARNADLSARALLERGAERLSAEGSGDAAIDAQLHLTMGSLLAEIGDPAAALVQYEAGLALNSPDTALRAELLHEQARALSRVERYEESEATAREALALREAMLGPDHVDVGHALQSLGVAVQQLNRGDEAETIFLRAESIFASQEPPDLEALASSRHNMAWIAQRRGDMALASERYLQAVEDKTALYGWDDPSTLRSMVSLAQALADNGNHAQAIDWMRRAVEGRRQTNGDNSLETAFALNEMGFLLNDAGDLGAALAYYREGLDIALRVVPESAEVARLLNNTASLQEMRGDLTSAESYLRESLALRVRLFGPDHVNTLRVENNLCRVLAAKSQREDARRCITDVFERRRRVLGEDAGETDDSRALLESLGETPDRDWLLARYRHYREQGAAQIVRAMRFGWLLASSTPEPDDIERLTDLARTLREYQGENSVRAALTELHLAGLALQFEQPEALTAALARCEAVLDRSLAPEAPQRAQLSALQALRPASAPQESAR